MKAITIMEPWASMIAHGFKVMETRSWQTNYRGRVAIHAGKGSPNKKWREHVPEMLSILDGDVCPGCIIAYADIVDCVEIDSELIEEVKRNHIEHISGFYEVGRYAFVLDNIQPIKPVKAKGKQRIWNYTEEEK